MLQLVGWGETVELDEWLIGCMQVIKWSAAVSC
jgi:hypothetical protein